MKAVLLAGGRGARLRPFTTNFPKPLMPIGDIPILEVLLRQLRHHDVRDITLLTGHLAYLLEGYFGDGSRLGMRMDYVREESPLGTAGPLRSLAGRFVEDLLVMNGDLLTNLDFGSLIQRHAQTDAVATVCTYRRDERVEFGVLKLSEAGDVIGYDEKPTLHVDVSMGAYVMSPSVLAAIPDRPYDMPQLIQELVAQGQRVSTYRHTGVWFDIGRVDDYEQANELFMARPDTFLPTDA